MQAKEGVFVLESFWQGKRVVVTGGDGFLGSHVIEQLHPKKPASIFVVRSKEYDLRIQSETARLLKEHPADILIHLAASVGGIGFNRENPGSLFYDNLTMGSLLIEEARRSKVAKTVVLGTICAYPKFTAVPFREDDLWNGYPEETNAPYGIAKKALLVQCQAYRAQYGMNAIFLLPVNLYGPRDNFSPASSHVIPALIVKFAEAIRERRPKVTCWGDGSPTREFLFVEDCARAICLACEQYNGGDPVNIGSGEEISIRDLAHLIAEVMGYDGQIEWDVTMPGGQPRRRLDISKAEKEFSFRAKKPFREGLQETVEWYLKNHP